MSAKLARLKNEANTALAAAKAIATKALDEGRDMNSNEFAEYTGHLDAAGQLVEQIKAARRDQDLLKRADQLAADLGLDDIDTARGDLGAQGEDPTRAKAASLGLQVVGSAQFKSLMGAFGRDEYGQVRVPDRARVQSDPIPVDLPRKALFVGGSPTSAGPFVVPERTDIVEMLGRRALTVRDLISVRRTTSDTVEYVVQTSHTNAAAPVPEATSSAPPTAPGGAGALVNDPAGGYKPEGSWAFARRTATVKTLAEWVPATKRALADVAQLEGLIRDELAADLAETEEAQILNGSGVGENLPGILGTSGIQTIAKGADTFPDALRKAITKARTVGRVAPSGIVLNPVEVEKLDLLKDTQGRYFGSGPWGIGPRTAWGVPVVESEIMPAGTGLVADFSKAVLWDREQTTVTISDAHADFFIRNLVALLAEERVAFAVTRPSAFCTVTGL
ncbi:phage major capsid protein [Longispora albida]|uniref:phage major capsid protein n=1 Tax=Longispora albida TaxID=203523 RepID=UPI00037B2592|nr:phage major capsid protein [Longispora albida]